MCLKFESFRAFWYVGTEFLNIFSLLESLLIFFSIISGRFFLITIGWFDFLLMYLTSEFSLQYGLYSSSVRFRVVSRKLHVVVLISIIILSPISLKSLIVFFLVFSEVWLFFRLMVARPSSLYKPISLFL